MVTENMQAEIADLEAELEEACRGPLDFEEKGRYSWPVALKVARRLLEIVRCTAPLAEVGKAVEGMPVGFGLSHAGKELWLVWDSGGGEDLDETCGPTPLAALEALAALRAAKGES